MAWTVVLVDEVTDWYLLLLDNDPETAEAVAASINLLESHGPSLGRPAVERIGHSTVHNLKELRPGSRGSSEVRVLFVFDPARQAVLLVAGDKAGAWEAWYRESIPLAEQRYANWLAGGYDEERGVMARNWKDVRAEAVATGRLNEERVEALRRQMLAEVRAHRLAEIREAYGLNQADVAGRLGVSQSRVSRLERGDMDHTELATIRAYVGALGGEVEIVAKFGDERIAVG